MLTFDVPRDGLDDAPTGAIIDLYKGNRLVRTCWVALSVQRPDGLRRKYVL